jgi:D-alanyl-D-alanine carboxypeptidase
MTVWAATIAVVLLAASCSSTTDATTASSIAPTTTSSVAPSTTSSALVLSDNASLQSIADGAGSALLYVSDAEGAVTAVSGAGTNGSLIGPDDVFFLGSGSKMITAVAILQLVDQGLVGLDDLLADYVDFEVATPISIRHLLQHKSGLGDNGDIYDTCDPDEVIEGLAALAVRPFNLAPGVGASYSTNGFNMLSLVMSSATGMSAAEVLRQNIFEPLDMASTFFTGAEDGPLLVVGEDSWDHDCAADKMDIGTGGGFASTAADLDTFMRALFEGDLLSEESFTEMTTVDSNVYGFDYGLGIGVLYPPDGRDQPMYGHWGTFDWEAGALYDPQAQRTIAMLVSGQQFESTIWKAANWANTN